MSAAKMVADSTQSDLPEKTTKKRKKEVQKKKVKKKKSTDKKGKKKASEDEFDEHDLDLENEVQPLGHFVKDREELMRQLFHCVQGTSLQRALPDVLKELPIEDLQKRCLEHLTVMSKKRIRRIIAGDDPASISSSGTEDDTSEEEQELDQQDEVEAEAMEEEDYEGQMVDSTSQYTGGLADSDREFDDNEAGSPGPSGQSPIYSDMEEYTTQEQEDVINSDYYEDSQDSIPEKSPSPIPEPVVVVDADYEPEEGEVTDDYVVKTEDGTIKIGIDKVSDESNEKKEGQADSETKDTDIDSTNTNTKNTAVDPDTKSADADSKEVESETKEVDSTDDKTDSDKTEDDAKDKAVDETNDENKTAEDTVKTADELKETTPTEDTASADTIVVAAASKEVKSEAPKPGTSRRVVLPPSEALAPVLTKNQMELLELEMRARAIKAMLKTAK